MMLTFKLVAYVLVAALFTAAADVGDSYWRIPRRFYVPPNRSGPPPDDWPMCPTTPEANCEPLEGRTINATYSYYRYMVDGMLTVIYHLKDKFVLSCYDNVSLYTPSLPTFRRPMHVSSAYIKYCEVPADSYAHRLARLNVNVTRGLILSFRFKDKPSLNKQHFIGLSIDYIRIQNIFSESVQLTSDWMEPLTELTSMDLDHVLLPPLSPGNKLMNVSLDDVVARGEWGDCSYLQELWVDGLKWEEGKAPPRWLAGCTKLRVVRLIRVEFGEWPEGALQDAHSLQSLKIQDHQLTALPVDFLNGTTALRELIIFGSKLIQLSHYISDSLRPVQGTLRSLVLAGNPVGNLCSEREDDVDANPLYLPGLERLSLQMCNATRICESWSRDLPALTYLNMEYNDIRELQFKDLQWLGARPRVLDLTRSNVSRIVYTSSQHQAVLRGDCTQFDVEILLTEPLDCDCQSYWFARTLEVCPRHVAWSRAPLCRSGEEMARVPPEQMLCIREEHQCAPGCKCFWRESPDATIANCPNSGLTFLPRIPRLRELHAGYNAISTIDVTDIPDTLVYADLRHNNIVRLEGAAAAALFAVRGRRVLLAGNALQCDCDNRPLLDELLLHQHQVDYADIKCASGELISTDLVDDLCALTTTQLLVYTLSPIVGLLVLVVIAGWIMYCYRTEVKVYLYARNMCQWCVNEEELDCDMEYDAFVSYSHHDERFVYERLVPELEREPHRFKLCIHTRDWPVGEWVPAQIVHSVQSSRRTIIVMTRRFLSSVWGRMEFRTAHMTAMREGRARIIIVLVEDLVDHPELDEELKSYLATNTYLKWGDPRFFDKLRYALPHRRGEYEKRKAGEEVAQWLQLTLRKQREDHAVSDRMALKMRIEDSPILQK
ncbi:protein toll-like [Aphomia sociella]